MRRAFGLDTSHWDGKMDWIKAKKQGAPEGCIGNTRLTIG